MKLYFVDTFVKHIYVEILPKYDIIEANNGIYRMVTKEFRILVLEGFSRFRFSENSGSLLAMRFVPRFT